MGKEASKMEEKQESHKKKPFVEPKLIKEGNLDEVTFQPAGYGDPAADPPAHVSPFSALPFVSVHHHHKRR